MGLKTLRSVLLIEDDTDIEELVRLSLEKIGGVKVTCALKNEIKEKDTVDADLILLDIIEPEKSLKSMVANVRKSYKADQTPIILLTAKRSLKLTQEERLLGILDVIYKPFHPTQLNKEIMRHWKGLQVHAKDIEFEAKLGELTQKYLNALPEKCAAIKRLWEDLSQNAWNQESFNALYKLVHHLSGTASTFKHPELTEQAKRVVLILQRIQEDSDSFEQYKDKVAIEIKNLMSVCVQITESRKGNKNVI